MRHNNLRLNNLSSFTAMMVDMRRCLPVLFYLSIILFLVRNSSASLGDHLPDFRDCVRVCEIENCQNTKASLPFHLRLLLWTCSSECDYTCQHVVTDRRLAREPPMITPIVQFHGKWPFYRFMGMQEPFSVLFSLLNFLAHRNGMDRVRQSIPAKYSLRPYYLTLGYLGLASWVFSMIFHTRDFNLTEKMDYFAAGASVLYSLYYAPVRIFRLDQQEPTKQSILRIWTVLCVGLYAAHVSYLTLWRWDYTYNMAANVAVGMVQNLMWSWFSITRYRKIHKTWAAWPGLIVVWIIMVMGLELFDFPPLWGMIDAHSLWHLGTVAPTIWWYSFLIKDAEEDIGRERLKA